MTNTEFVDILIKHAKGYRPGSAASIKRNHHMNIFSGDPVDQGLVDATIVDFINYVGLNQCCLDVALYASDLLEDE